MTAQAFTTAEWGGLIAAALIGIGGLVVLWVVLSAGVKQCRWCGYMHNGTRCPECGGRNK